jgi:hypothetical protein
MSKTPVDPSLRAAGLESKAWPFEEARKLLKRVEQKKTRHDYILFETGYGPSGLPHIGTFGEVARTTMVRRAFRVLTDKVATADLLFRRHGRHAQDAGQRAGPGASEGRICTSR